MDLSSSSIDSASFTSLIDSLINEFEHSVQLHFVENPRAGINFTAEEISWDVAENHMYSLEDISFTYNSAKITFSSNLTEECEIFGTEIIWDHYDLRASRLKDNCSAFTKELETNVVLVDSASIDSAMKSFIAEHFIPVLEEFEQAIKTYFIENHALPNQAGETNFLRPDTSIYSLYLTNLTISMTLRTVPGCTEISSTTYIPPGQPLTTTRTFDGCRRYYPQDSTFVLGP